MRRKNLKIAVVTIAVVATAGIAYGYWTGSGSGSGEGDVGDSGTVTLTATFADGIAPGTDRSVSFTAENASDSPIMVDTVSLDGIAVDAGHAACDTADFSMADVTETHEVPAGATVEALPVDASLVYANTAVNQDACKGATLTLTLSSN